MRKNIAKVIEAFKRGEAAQGDSKRTCWTDGKTVYSYAMRIAWREEDGSITITDERSTRTTNGQITALRVAFARPRCTLHADCKKYREVGEECLAQARKMDTIVGWLDNGGSA